MVDGCMDGNYVYICTADVSMYVCMYVCMYVRTYVCMYVRTIKYGYTNVLVRMCVSMYVYLVEF